MKATVLDRQSIFDLAIQELGIVEAAFAFSIENDLSLTENLEVGQELVVTDKENKAIANYYENRGLKPATGITEEQSKFEGIEFMGIEIDFIVS